MACLPMPERLPLQPLLSALKHPEVLVSYSGAQWDQLMRLARAGDLVVDFADVTVADSAALALLLDWMRCARAYRRPGLSSCTV